MKIGCFGGCILVKIRGLIALVPKFPRIFASGTLLLIILETLIIWGSLELKENIEAQDQTAAQTKIAEAGKFLRTELEDAVLPLIVIEQMLLQEPSLIDLASLIPEEVVTQKDEDRFTYVDSLPDGPETSELFRQIVDEALTVRDLKVLYRKFQLEPMGVILKEAEIGNYEAPSAKGLEIINQLDTTNKALTSALRNKVVLGAKITLVNGWQASILRNPIYVNESEGLGFDTKIIPRIEKEVVPGFRLWGYISVLIDLGETLDRSGMLTELGRNYHMKLYRVATTAMDDEEPILEVLAESGETKLMELGPSTEFEVFGDPWLLQIYPIGGYGSTLYLVLLVVFSTGSVLLSLMYCSGLIAIYTQKDLQQRILKIRLVQQLQADKPEVAGERISQLQNCLPDDLLKEYCVDEWLGEGEPKKENKQVFKVMKIHWNEGKLFYDSAHAMVLLKSSNASLTEVKCRALANEAVRLTRVISQNVARLQSYHFSADHTSFGLVYELLQGQTLHEVKLAQPFKEQEVHDIGQQVLQGLKCMHGHGVTHRNIQPSNIMRVRAGTMGMSGDSTHHKSNRPNPDDYTYVLIGTSSIVERAAQEHFGFEFQKGPFHDSQRWIGSFSTTSRSTGTVSTLTGGWFGSNRNIPKKDRHKLGAASVYMSPEQLQQLVDADPKDSPSEEMNPGDFLPIDQRTDVWGLGITLLELLLNHIPCGHKGSSVACMDLPVEIKGKDIMKWGSGEGSFNLTTANWIATSLQNDISRRYQSADDMLMALDRIKVRRNQKTFSIYISYRHDSSRDAEIAKLLYDHLNGTFSPMGLNHVSVSLGTGDAKPNFSRPASNEGESSDMIGDCLCLSNSMIHIPIISEDFTSPMAGEETRGKQLPPYPIRLRGGEGDEQDQALIELQLALALLTSREARARGIPMQRVLPLLVGRSTEEGKITSFFDDGSNGGGGDYPDSESGASTSFVSSFLRSHFEIDMTEEYQSWTIKETMNRLFKLQGVLLASGSNQDNVDHSNDNLDTTQKGDHGLETMIVAITPRIYKVVDQVVQSKGAPSSPMRMRSPTLNLLVPASDKPHDPSSLLGQGIELSLSPLSPTMPSEIAERLSTSQVELNGGKTPTGSGEFLGLPGARFRKLLTQQSDEFSNEDANTAEAGGGRTDVDSVCSAGSDRESSFWGEPFRRTVSVVQLPDSETLQPSDLKLMVPGLRSPETPETVASHDDELESQDHSNPTSRNSRPAQQEQNPEARISSPMSFWRFSDSISKKSPDRNRFGPGSDESTEHSKYSVNSRTRATSLPPMTPELRKLGIQDFTDSSKSKPSSRRPSGLTWWLGQSFSRHEHRGDGYFGPFGRWQKDAKHDSASPDSEQTSAGLFISRMHILVSLILFGSLCGTSMALINLKASSDHATLISQLRQRGRDLGTHLQSSLSKALMPVQAYKAILGRADSLLRLDPVVANSIFTESSLTHRQLPDLPRESVEAFKTSTGSMLREYDSITSLLTVQLEPRGIVTMSYPPNPAAEASTGLDLLASRREAYFEAMVSAEDKLEGPLEYEHVGSEAPVDPRSGFMNAIVPLYVSSDLPYGIDPTESFGVNPMGSSFKWWGFGSGMIDVKSLLELSGLAQFESEGYRFEIYRSVAAYSSDGIIQNTADQLVTRSEGFGKASDEIVIMIDMIGGNWTLKIQPELTADAIWFPISMTCAVLFSGIFTASALAVFLSQRRSEELLSEHHRQLVLKELKAAAPDTDIQLLSQLQQRLPKELIQDYGLVESLQGLGSQTVRSFKALRLIRCEVQQPVSPYILRLASKCNGEYITNQDLMRIRVEASAFRECPSPHMVKLFSYDVTKDGLSFWFLTEMVPGESLQAILNDPRRGHMSESSAILACNHVLLGLSVLHHHGIIHRRITAVHVFCRPGKAKADKATYVITDIGSALTPQPATISANIDHESLAEWELSRISHAEIDMWSVGVLMWHLLTGKLPFAGSATDNLLKFGKTTAADRLPSLVSKVPRKAKSSLGVRSSCDCEVFIKKVLEPTGGNPCFANIPDMLDWLSTPSVDQSFTIFLSYRVSTDAVMARAIFDQLNNSITPRLKHRVRIFLDSVGLVDGQDWEEGFMEGLVNSHIFVPLVTQGYIEPLEGEASDPRGPLTKRIRLKGTEDDTKDHCLQEILTAKALLQNRCPESKLRAILPIYVGPIYRNGEADQLFHKIRGTSAFPDKVSPTTTNKVVEYLRSYLGLECQEQAEAWTLRSVMNELLYGEKGLDTALLTPNIRKVQSKLSRLPDYINTRKSRKSSTFGSSDGVADLTTSQRIRTWAIVKACRERIWDEVDSVLLEEQRA